MADTDKRFEELKQKYSSVMNLIQQQQVSLSHVNMQDNKLFIQGTATSDQVKNKVWDQIKLADPNWQSDLIADISVSGNGQPQSQPASNANGSSAARTYTVQAGDNLSKIAKQFYGNANEYNKIFEANKDKLSSPDKIQPGQVLNIPE